MLVTVRLDKNLAKRLNDLASETHRSRSYYIKMAINDYLNEREDYLLALAAFEKKEPITSIEEVKKELGLGN
jgi:RHH-type transcriptional regulator, rel operon repressor / antitoxin RelB